MGAALEEKGKRNRDRASRRSRALTDAVSDIGAIPAVADPVRRESCRLNLELFLQTYFPNSTGLSPFSDDHRRVIARIQKCILEGGRFCNAVYRGFAKTTISQNAAIWATVYGHRRCVIVFGADQGSANRNMGSIKREFSGNELLAEDFPEVCHAVIALEGKAQRCASQTCLGEPTHISWTAESIVMPSIKGSKAAGSVLASQGLTGSGSRGFVFKTPAGENLRPDFVIIDDPQTNETASTPLQVAKRLDIIRRSILKAGGHRNSMAAVVNATVIAKDDLVEQLLNPTRSPSWQGERIKMVRAFSAAHEDHWLGKYAEIRNTFNRDQPEDQRRAHRDATAYYIEHKTAMDAGCVVSWENCFDPEAEVSAIQHAYNILIDDGPDVFASECQNEPLEDVQDADIRLSAAEIITRLNGFERGKFPRECEHLTAFVDIQQTLLYYVVCAWQQDFTGYVVDYGAWPDQGRRYFRLSEARKTLQTEFPGTTGESQWYEALGRLATQLCGRTYERMDGAKLQLGKMLIDANYGYSTRVVKRFCLVSPWKATAMATHGRGIRAGDLPMAEWPVKPGERRGFNWLMRPDAEAQGLRHVLYDTNYWKSFIHARLRNKAPAAGSLSLWGMEPRAHEMIADHLTAEYAIRTEGRGRVVDQWELRPERPDNHWLDCLVGCAVGASMLGASLEQHGGMKPKKQKKSLAEMAKAARGAA